MKRLCFILAILLTGWSSPTHAMTIGLGLDWRRNVFVQPYWEGGKSKYLLANLQAAPAKISIREWRAAATAKPLAGPWDIQPGAALNVDAPATAAGTLAEWTIAGGEPLGLLSAPMPVAGKPAGRIVTNEGLNGSGGAQKDLWCEHETLTFKSGAEVVVLLLVPPGGGTIKFQKKPEHPLVPALAIAKAECSTLKIHEDEKTITIDAGAAGGDTKPHSIRLVFHGLKVTKPTLVMFDGWRMQPGGGGHGITRGLIIAP